MNRIISSMIIQMVAGIWLFISPFVMGFKEMTIIAINNMVLGAVVVILGLGVSLYEYHHEQEFHRMAPAEKKST
jgi:hypothetical protein